ncbi:MAG TPA: heavy metal translocating P-type ATPase [Candidatus Tectomicrobia bacterium]|nr:heavy metal translocating P-type ATPase [Candidatus Tectomicrobia bacterium]
MHEDHHSQHGSPPLTIEASHTTQPDYTEHQAEAPAHQGHAAPPAEQSRGGTEDHTAHARDKHAGHTPEMFRDRFWLSLLLTLPILYFDMHFQEWFGYTAPQFPGSNWVQPALSIVLYVYGGGVFVQGAWRELKARQPGMMTLIGLAISVAFVYSLTVSAGLLRGMPLYWELATLIVVMLLGHWIEMASVQGASRALEHLAALVPATAHRLIGERIEDVPVTELQVSDRVLVRPGEQIPIDGAVLEGSSSVNEAFLTGESRPVPKEPGAEVIAGAVNGEGALVVEVRRTGEATTLSQIQRLVAEAQRARSRFQALADRAAYWLTLIALGAGSLTLVAWLLLGFTPEFALTRMVAVMVIACPHALGLAIPLVVVNATALSARNGILVRNREAFERARDTRVVAFDKTGTLTEGQFGLRAVYVDGLKEEEAIRIATALETRSEHPLAEALVHEAEQRGLRTSSAEDVKAVPGRGVEGNLNGEFYRVGRPEWAEELNLSLSPPLRRGLDEAEARGESVIALMDSKQVLALFALADRVRASARTAVAQLQRMQITPVMVTGDAEAVARTVAQELGLERYYARVLPQDKARIVRELKSQGQTAFVGDGINDAPALQEADLGIAIGAGTNVAIESADLVLVESDPLDVVAALRLSRAAYSKMVQNLLWATGYNAITLPLAAGVAYAWGILLSPAVGAIFMSASTVIVAVNAMLLRRLRLAG